MTLRTQPYGNPSYYALISLRLLINLLPMSPWGVRQPIPAGCDTGGTAWCSLTGGWINIYLRGCSWFAAVEDREIEIPITEDCLSCEDIEKRITPYLQSLAYDLFFKWFSVPCGAD